MFDILLFCSVVKELSLLIVGHLQKVLDRLGGVLWQRVRRLQVFDHSNVDLVVEHLGAEREPGRARTEKRRCTFVSTRILGWRTAPFSPSRIPNRAPHGVAPRS